MGLSLEFHFGLSNQIFEADEVEQLDLDHKIFYKLSYSVCHLSLTSTLV